MFVFAYIGGDGNNIFTENNIITKIFPRLKIENYNIEIDGKNFLGSIN